MNNKCQVEHLPRALFAEMLDVDCALFGIEVWFSSINWRESKKLTFYSSLHDLFARHSFFICDSYVVINRVPNLLNCSFLCLQTDRKPLTLLLLCMHVHWGNYWH